MTECSNRTCSRSTRSIYCSDRCRWSARNGDHRLAVTVRLEIDIYRELVAAAARERMDVAELVHMLIVDEVDG